MADLHKFTVQESLNASQGSAGGWTVGSRLTLSSAAHAYKELDVSTTQIGIYSDSEVLFRFDTSTSDTISTTTDLIIPSNTLIFLTVPKNVGSSIVVHFKQVSSAASSFLRIVEV